MVHKTKKKSIKGGDYIHNNSCDRPKLDSYKYEDKNNKDFTTKFKIYAKIENVKQPISINYDEDDKPKQYEGTIYNFNTFVEANAKSEISKDTYTRMSIPLFFILYRSNCNNSENSDYENIYEKYNNLVEYKGTLYSPDFTVNTNPSEFLKENVTLSKSFFNQFIIINYVPYDPTLDPFPKATLIAAKRTGIKISPETLDTWNRIIDEKKQIQSSVGGSRKKSSKKVKKSSKKSSKKSTKRRK